MRWEDPSDIDKPESKVPGMKKALNPLILKFRIPLKDFKSKMYIVKIHAAEMF